MSLADRARKLASLTAASAGAIALTSGAAKADVIISTPDLTVSFTSNSNPTSFHDISHAIPGTALGPRFSAVLYSLGGGATFNRFANLYHGSRSTSFLNPRHARVAAGQTWSQALVSSGTYGRVADRLWGGVSDTHGLPAGTGFYELFRFVSDTKTDYGWIEYNIAMTEADSSLAADGPNLTVVEYAWDNDPTIHLATGQTSIAPEPSTLALSALVLGAEGLRRWRKSRKTA